MKVAEIGEFGLIDMIRGMVASPGRGLVVGIGDDCAVLDCPSDGEQLLATIDMLVERVHFNMSYTTPHLLGRKSLCVGLSDIAAMGGQPLVCLISLGLKASTDVSFAREFYEGLLEAGREYGCALGGGDTVSSPHDTIVDVCVLGTVPRGGAFLRSAAVPGQLVLATGHLGRSAAGLELLLRHGPPGDPRFSGLVRAHLDPVPRLREAVALRRAGGVSAMMDISDGLANEINHIARESSVGAVVFADRLPIGESTTLAAEHLGLDAVALALFGGEDYELVFCVDPARAEDIRTRVMDESGTPVAIVGEIREKDRGVMLNHRGVEVPLLPRAYDHFKARFPVTGAQSGA
jgi:thiamine-monophosphate kinase